MFGRETRSTVAAECSIEFHRTLNIDLQPLHSITLSFNFSNMSSSPLLFWVLLGLLALVAGYEVPVSDTDYSRQICSGMWGGKSTYINGMHAALLATMSLGSSIMQSHLTRDLRVKWRW